MTQPLHKNRPRGLGIYNWLKRRLAATPGTAVVGMTAFRTLVLAAPLTRVPGVGKVFKRLIMFNKERWTQSYSVPLNVEIPVRGEPRVLPVDLLKKVVREASYRAALNECICRTSHKCKKYGDSGVACIFLGRSGRICVENGIAHEASVEECCERIDKAAALGLAGQAYWVELEELVWGIQNEDLDHFLEICFCCPCCCTAFKFGERADAEMRARFHRTIGWTAEVGEACLGCGECVDVCPRYAMALDGDKVAIAQDLCGGCGLCVPVCPSSALRLEQRTPLKADLKDYFEGLDLKL